ncbi:MAG: hypothetical protein AAF531_20315, partial [Actinomycetota bacterium]
MSTEHKTEDNVAPSDTSPGTDGPGGRRAIEPADLCRFRTVGEIRLHPNTTDLVYGVTWPDRETDTNRSVLYATTVDGDGHRQLTHGHRDTGASFSPDGTRLAF